MQTFTNCRSFGALICKSLASHHFRRQFRAPVSDTWRRCEIQRQLHITCSMEDSRDSQEMSPEKSVRPTVVEKPANAPSLNLPADFKQVDFPAHTTTHPPTHPPTHFSADNCHHIFPTFLQVLFIESGFGADQHGQNATVIFHCSDSMIPL